MLAIHRGFAVLCLTSATAPSGSAQSARQMADSFVVSSAWLAEHLADRKVVVLHVTHDMDGRGEFRAGHIPGAREVSYMAMTATRDGLSTELPPVDSLRAAFEALGVSNDTRVVVYGPEAPMVTRVLFTLYYLGLDRVSFLDGGLSTWRAEGRPISTASAAETRGRLTTTPRAELIATADWIVPRLGKAGTAFVDTRTDGEYLGTGGRRGLPSAGHLEGARQVEWEDLFRAPDLMLLKDRQELSTIFEAFVRPGDTVVTYCWVGYRASATWLAAKLLGYDARFYDGSYQDWQLRKLPVRAGAIP